MRVSWVLSFVCDETFFFVFSLKFSYFHTSRTSVEVEKILLHFQVILNTKIDIDDVTHTQDNRNLM